MTSFLLHSHLCIYVNVFCFSFIGPICGCCPVCGNEYISFCEGDACKSLMQQRMIYYTWGGVEY